MALISPRRIVALVLMSVLLIGGTVFAAATVERKSDLHAAAQQRASQLMLMAMINQETGARGYFETRDTVFLQPYNAGAAAFAQALSDSRALAGTDPVLRLALTDQAQRSAVWHADAQAQISRLRSAGQAPTVGQALASKATMDGFRTANASFDAQLMQRRDATLTAQTWYSVGLAAALSVALVFVGIMLVRRAARHDSRRLGRQRELRELLQVSESERESRLLLIRHIERTVPGCAAAVFNRNNSDDRLEPMINEQAETTALRGVVLEQLKPRSCMAVRLTHAHERRPGETTLTQCEVCGKIEGDVACEPLLVGGQVIGSVLIARKKTIGERERGRVRDSVVQAAPILANQRNLALAQLRAASDALTGLPNRRAADETLKRMSAHAGRTVSPLAAVLLDLDHFKQVNDLHGHELGDKALAAVGQILSSTLRGSDFAARYGGEEFLVLLPDTDRSAARDVAEKLRVAIECADIPHIAPLTASFGVAAIPTDASEGEHMIRKADRALYAAKAGGRNRVEVVGQSGIVAPAASPDLGSPANGRRPLPAGMATRQTIG
jgi:diguanylate cyclase (GGDEF)-like protein